ncbi:MAG TPA: hypothetical protein VJK04_02860 [Candidatus Paceibacterota bacterium]
MDSRESEHVKTAFRKYHKDTSDKSGDFDKNPLVKLARIYLSWINRYFGHNAPDMWSNIEKVFSGVKFNLEELTRFHELFPALQDENEVQQFPHENTKDGLEYQFFLFAACEILKRRRVDWSSAERTEFHPYFKSEKLLPTVKYFVEHSSRGTIKFEGFDMVVLTACSSVWFGEFGDGLAVKIDCTPSDSPYGISAGYQMTGGKIIFTKNAKVGDLGQEMRGGKLEYQGSLHDVRRIKLGDYMRGGCIEIEGDVQGGLTLGYEMKGGEIIIDGSLIIDTYAAFGLGSPMNGGRIVIKKNLEVRDKNSQYGVGSLMTDGEIVIEGKAEGNASVGASMYGGVIRISRDCIIQHIGDGQHGGKIYIGGNAGVNIGFMMRNGLVDISGSVEQYGYESSGNRVFYWVGNHMEGGTIRIGRNVECVGMEMKGGRIEIGGTLENETDFVKMGGEIIVRGRRVEPKLKYRILGSIFKKLDK